MMRRRNLLLPVILGEALVCFLIYDNFAHHKFTQGISLAWCVTAFIAALILLLLTDIPAGMILLWVVVGALAGDVANIIYDVSRGTSSHNLFPLEMAVRGAIGFVGAVLGVALGGPFRNM